MLQNLQWRSSIRSALGIGIQPHPLNLAGIVVPGERVPAISGKHLSFKDGVLVETPDVQPLSFASRP